MSAIIALEVLDSVDLAKDAIGLVVYAGGEEEGGGWTVKGTISAKGDGPEAVDVDGVIVGAGELALEGSAYGVEGKNFTAAELSYEDVMAMRAEVSGCKRQTPGGIEPGAVLETVEQATCWGEDIDEALACTVDLIVPAAIPLGVGDITVSADVLDVERRVTLGMRSSSKLSSPRCTGLKAAS